MSNEAARQALQAVVANTGAIAAWKVALNFPGPQKQLGLTHALAAPIGNLRNHESGARIEVGADRRVHVEAEIALTLSSDIHAAEPPEQLRERVHGFAPCLELVDYAYPRDSLGTMYEHTFFHAGVVRGQTRPLAELVLEPGKPVARNTQGKQHARLVGPVPDDIFEALAGLVARVCEAGGSLKRGQLVLCGSYIEPIALDAGGWVEVDYGVLGALRIARA